MKVLIVTNPFGGHEIGGRITDPQEIEQTLSGEHAHHVVQADHADAAVDPSDAPEINTTQEA